MIPPHRFYQLTKLEEFYKEKLYQAWKKSKQYNSPELIEALIKEYDTEIIFKLALTNSEFNEVCKSPNLEPHWINLWRLCGTNPREEAEENNEPIQEFSPMLTVSSCFELLKGYYLYQRYLTLVDMEGDLSEEELTDAKKLLLASADCGCFFAMNALCREGLLTLKEAFREDTALLVFHYATLAAELYLAPGYLLLGSVCQELIRYKDNTDWTPSQLAQLAFQSYTMAKYLEPISGPMLNNAYQGQSLTEASKGAFSTFFKAQLRMQEHLRLSPEEVNKLTAKAKIEANRIEAYYIEKRELKQKGGDHDINPPHKFLN
ncbi:DUF5630 domain-containing protein [Legionella rowbothamii]|uniref:DUF5630 domain-containing protein n=1 Tax=Legionella rowbothamii TaxID=96229 RepID=UPI001056185E|nr:DUF5630 domain-containing protein [Legionella rowbothamii]